MEIDTSALKLVQHGDDDYPYYMDYGPRWMAANGDHVGCHKGTTRPLGVPASAETRKARMAAHEVFDRLWKGSGAVMSRRSAYARISSAFGYEVHIGQSDVETCERIIEWARHCYVNMLRG